MNNTDKIENKIIPISINPNPIDMILNINDNHFKVTEKSTGLCMMSGDILDDNLDIRYVNDYAYLLVGHIKDALNEYIASSFGDMVTIKQYVKILGYDMNAVELVEDDLKWDDEKIEIFIDVVDVVSGDVYGYYKLKGDDIWKSGEKNSIDVYNNKSLITNHDY